LNTRGDAPCDQPRVPSVSDIGHYRRDLFESVGAAEAFLRVLFETADKFDWRVHAYVLMRNHFHLAIETDQANMGEGMHWLQTTMSTRFNRLRKEHGHLFVRSAAHLWAPV